MANLVHKIRGAQSGFSLLETMFALVVLCVGMTGVMSLFGVAASYNSTQGDVATKTAEYAQDQMETLVAQPYSTLATVPGTIYRGIDGSLFASNGTTPITATTAFYTVVWSVIPDAETNRGKTITVTVTGNKVVLGASPSTTLMAVVGPY